MMYSGDSIFYSYKSHIFPVTDNCFPYIAPPELLPITIFLIHFRSFTSSDETRCSHGMCPVYNYSVINLIVKSLELKGL